MPNAAQRLARRGRSLAKQAASQGFNVARGTAERVLERAFGHGAGEGRPAGAPTPPRSTTAPPPPATRSAAEAVEAERAAPRAWQPSEAASAPPDPALEHVVEEATLAAESSDAGAENGAGAEVVVSPPWPGYDRMRARDIVDRLAGADPELAAGVRLYEASTKGRKTVLEAAERSIRGAR